MIPAVLHGAHDAAAFLTLISPLVGYVALYGVVLVGALIGLIEYVRKDTLSRMPTWAPPGAT